MTTLCRRTFVSIATIAMTLTLGACATARPATERPVSTLADLLSIRFDNVSSETVDVYLIGAKREWMLGRVAPGAVATLRLPEETFIKGSPMVRLAVLVGQPQTFAAAQNPRAVLTIAEPASAILTQRWTFSLGGLTSLRF